LADAVEKLFLVSWK